jgi:hypothetical protein
MVRMKEEIVGVLSLPYLDKFIVKVVRQLDRFHVATERLYIAPYTNPKKVWSLYRHFTVASNLVTEKILEKRIENWRVNVPKS